MPRRKRTALNLFGLDGAMPAWWKTPTPTRGQVCYKTKGAAVRAFADWNQDIVERYGGPTAKHTPAEFDAINNRYGLKKQSKADTIGRALWESFRGSGPPWCLEDIDLETLNETSPAVHYKPFELPDVVLESVAERAEVKHNEDQAISEKVVADCFARRRWIKSGAFRKDGSPFPIPGTRPERACVCRDTRGRFARCKVTAHDDAPF